MRCPFCGERIPDDSTACEAHGSESGRLSAVAGAAAYAEEIERLEELLVTWPKYVAWIARSVAAQDLLTSLRHDGPRTVARAAKDLRLSQAVVVVVAQALEVRGELVVRARSRRPWAQPRWVLELNPGGPAAPRSAQ